MMNVNIVPVFKKLVAWIRTVLLPYSDKNGTFSKNV